MISVDYTELSSHDIQRVLDSLLAYAAWPIFMYSDSGIQFFSSLLPMLDDRRKRISMSVDNELLRQAILNALYSRKACFELLRTANLERNYLQQLLVKVVHTRKLVNCDTNVGCEQLCNIVEFFLTHYLRFREIIIARFDRSLQKAAHKNAHLRKIKGQVVEPEELLANYKTAAIKALDRLEPSKGSLSTNIIRWVKAADSGKETALVLGEAYKVSRVGRKNIATGKSTEISNSVSLDLAIEQPQLVLDNTEITHDNIISLAYVANAHAYLLVKGILVQNWTRNELYAASFNSKS